MCLVLRGQRRMRVVGWAKIRYSATECSRGAGDLRCLRDGSKLRKSWTQELRLGWNTAGMAANVAQARSAEGWAGWNMLVMDLVWEAGDLHMGR